MIHPERANASLTPLEPTNDLERGLYACDQSDCTPVVAYVSKMFSVARSELPQHRRKELTADEMRQRGKEERERRAQSQAEQQNGVPIDGIEGLTTTLETVNITFPVSGGAQNGDAESSEVLLGFSRIFSGVLRRDTPLIATLPKYIAKLGPAHPRNAKHIIRVNAEQLYMMMGRDPRGGGRSPRGPYMCDRRIGGVHSEKRYSLGSKRFRS